MDQVTNAIAVIGVYFALMAVLSVSVEAVIGWFKIPVPWLQGKPSPADALSEVKDWLDGSESGEIWEARVMALNKSLAAIGETQLDFGKGVKIADLVKRLGEATTKYTDSERVRRGVIRLMAVAFGMMFATLFQIDSLQLLAPLSQSAQRLWLTSLGSGGAHVAGLVLSGLAASAGSGFWHDQSARLRNIKKASEAAAGVVAGSGSV